MIVTKNIDDLIPHPAQVLIPPIKGEDRARLKEDLATNGQQDPIHITDANVILDGVQRWTLLRENGSTTIQTIVIAIPEGDQKGYVISRAVNRRHLTRAEIGALIDSLLMDVIEVRGKQRIGRSATEIARLVGVNQATVTRRRDQLMQTHKLPGAPTHAMGDDGKLYPLVSKAGPARKSGKPKPAAGAAASTESAPPAEAAPPAGTAPASGITPELQATLDRERALHILDMIEQIAEFAEGTSQFSAAREGKSDVDIVLATGVFDRVALAIGERALVGLKRFVVEAALAQP